MSTYGTDDALERENTKKRDRPQNKEQNRTDTPLDPTARAVHFASPLSPHHFSLVAAGKTASHPD